MVIKCCVYKFVSPAIPAPKTVCIVVVGGDFMILLSSVSL